MAKRPLDTSDPVVSTIPGEEDAAAFEAPPAPPIGDAPPPPPSETSPPPPEGSAPDAAVPSSPAEKATVDADRQALRPEMAEMREETLRQALRENLIGTIGEWSQSGIAEVERVRGLLVEHGDWTAEEIAAVRVAFEGLSNCARSASDALSYLLDIEWLQLATVTAELAGYEPGDILDLNPSSGNVVMKDGTRIAVAR